MTTTASRQMTTGKSFEYALLVQFEEKLKDKTNLEVIKNSSFEIAKGCFENVSEKWLYFQQQKAVYNNALTV